MEIDNLLLKTSESKKKSKEKEKKNVLRKVKIEIQNIKTYEMEKTGF